MIVQYLGVVTEPTYHGSRTKHHFLFFKVFGMQSVSNKAPDFLHVLLCLVPVSAPRFWYTSTKSHYFCNIGRVRSSDRGCRNNVCGPAETKMKSENAQWSMVNELKSNDVSDRLKWIRYRGDWKPPRPCGRPGRGRVLDPDPPHYPDLYIGNLVPVCLKHWS